MLGNGAFEAVESGNPEDTITPETIQPDVTEPVPQEVVEIQPTEIEPEVTEVMTPTDPIVSEPVEELVVPSAEVEIAAVPVPEIKPEIRPEEEIKPVPEVKKEEPVKKVERKKPKGKAGPEGRREGQGQAERDARRGRWLGGCEDRGGGRPEEGQFLDRRQRGRHQLPGQGAQQDQPREATGFGWGSRQRGGELHHQRQRCGERHSHRAQFRGCGARQGSRRFGAAGGALCEGFRRAPANRPGPSTCRSSSTETCFPAVLPPAGIFCAKI